MRTPTLSECSPVWPLRSSQTGPALVPGSGNGTARGAPLPPSRPPCSPGQRGPVLLAAGHAARSAGLPHLRAPPPSPAQVGHLALIFPARPAPRADLPSGVTPGGGLPHLRPGPRPDPRPGPRALDRRPLGSPHERPGSAGLVGGRPGARAAGFLLRTSRTSSAPGASSHRCRSPGCRARGGPRRSGSG